MTHLLGCILCQIDVQSATLLMPIAQAAVISAPIVFRKEIRRGIDRARGRPASGNVTEEAAEGPTDGDEDRTALESEGD